MTTADWIQLAVLLLAILTYVVSRNSDKRQREVEAVARAQRDSNQHQQTRDQIRDLTHALELRVQSTERDLKSYITKTDSFETRITNIEKDIIRMTK